MIVYCLTSLDAEDPVMGIFTTLAKAKTVAKKIYKKIFGDDAVIETQKTVTLLGSEDEYHFKIEKFIVNKNIVNEW